MSDAPVTEGGPVLNTDREIWRGDHDVAAYYADSLHVTADGSIGINCGGFVTVMPVRSWHALPDRLRVAEERAEKAEHDPAVADAVYQAKLLVRLRDRFVLISKEIEDEGDRAYFGSTNDADDFKAIVGELDNFAWSRVMGRANGRDLYAEMRDLRSRAEAAESRAATQAARIAELEAEAARLRDDQQHMACEVGAITAAEDVLTWLLVEKIGVPDDVAYTPRQAQDIIASALSSTSPLNQKE